MAHFPSLSEYDPQIWNIISGEQIRQEDHVELIASENYASRAVMEAQGSVLTNKYAEGYPGKRYYGGCEWVDQAETIAIERAKELFGADYANVQPHSGSQANMAALLAMTDPGETILGMGLASGGHLTHGSPVNFSGRLFRAVSYGLHPENGLLDYDQMRQLALEHRPKVIIAGFSAYSRVVDWQIFRDVADEIGAWLMVDIAHVAGPIVAGIYPNPVPVADVVTTTTHKTLRGPRGGLILARAHETLHRKINSLIFPGCQGGPLMHVIAAKAVALKEAQAEDFRQYQIKVVENARAMAQRMMERHYKIVSSGTDNHMFLVDLIGHPLTGKQAEAVLGSANITTNKNAVPNDPASPFVTSGIRIGTPAITTRGFAVNEAVSVADTLCDILDHPEDQNIVQECRERMRELCRKYPVYQDTESGEVAASIRP